MRPKLGRRPTDRQRKRSAVFLYLHFEMTRPPALRARRFFHVQRISAVMTIDPIPAPTARLITRAEFASLLGMSIRTLENWERQGYGPTPVRFGRAVRYGADDVMTFILHRRSA